MRPATTHEQVIDPLQWDPRFTRELPGEERVDAAPRQVPGVAWSPATPDPAPAPTLAAWSPELAADLGLPPHPDTEESSALAAVFAGNAVVEGMEPFAQRYGGHQFGNWAGQLGDGRAMALGEVIDIHGNHQTLQLKGAGLTPYSRTADGRAVLRSSLREFLCSEAMHFLGVPTTRALSLVTTGNDVVRDMFYDGNPALEPGAVVCRVAPTFLRFGSYELPAALGEIDLLRDLFDFTLRNHFPHLGEPSSDAERRSSMIALFEEVCTSTADMILDWLRVGFVHGVMNTDNLSIAGLTIDYGPYGWLEDFDPNWTPNTTDRAHRRYRYGQQLAIGQWNLARLAGAFHVFVEDVEPLQAALRAYGERASAGWWSMWSTKLGLGPEPSHAGRVLIDELQALLQRTETDMTLFFRLLPDVVEDDAVGDRSTVAPLLEAYYRPDELAGDLLADTAGWVRRWRAHVDAGVRPAMDAVNPLYVPRNWLAQEAIDAATAGDWSVLHHLHDVYRNPYERQDGEEHIAEKRPEWARERAGCSMLSCSS